MGSSIKKISRKKNYNFFISRMSRKKSPPKRKYTTQGTKSLKEIQKYQKSTDLLMRKLPFIRLVREISRRVSGKEYRFQVAAMQCLQEAAETYIVNMFQAVQLCAIHCKRVTVMPRDIELVRRLQAINLAGIEERPEE